MAKFLPTSEHKTAAKSNCFQKVASLFYRKNVLTSSTHSNIEGPKKEAPTPLVCSVAAVPKKEAPASSVNSVAVMEENVSQQQAILDFLGIDIASVKKSARDEITTAFSCEQRGEYKKAAKSYDDAAWSLYDRIIHGGNWWLKFNVKAAENYEKAGKMDEAIAIYVVLHNSFIGSPQDQLEWCLKLAQTYEKAGYLQQAEEQRRYAKILESLVPHHPNPLGVIGKIGFDQED